MLSNSDMLSEESEPLPTCRSRPVLDISTDDEEDNWRFWITMILIGTSITLSTVAVCLSLAAFALYGGFSV